MESSVVIVVLLRTHGRPTVANRHHAWPLPRRLPVSVPAACHGLGFRHATPQCRSHRRPNTQLEEKCDRSCRNLVRFRTSARRAQGCRHPPISYQIPTLMHLQSYLHHLPHHITQLSKGTSTTIITQHTPFPLRPRSLSTRGGCKWLGRTELPDSRKASMEPLSKKSRWSNVLLRNHHSGSHSPSPSKCETKRRGEPFSLASNGTGVALAVPRNLASPSQHVVCCRSFPRVSTTYLPASPGHGGSPLLRDREDAVRGEVQAQVSTAQNGGIGSYRSCNCPLSSPHWISQRRYNARSTSSTELVGRQTCRS